MKRISTFAFTLELAEQGEAEVALRLRGELDVSVAMEARQLAEQELAAGKDLQFDLSGLDFVDSSGLFMLLRVSEQAEALGRRLTIVGQLESQVRRVLRVSGLTRLIPPA
jgi:anti-anti-sigma factor